MDWPRNEALGAVHLPLGDFVDIITGLFILAFALIVLDRL